MEVKKGSPADENGLKKGMIIQYISYGDGITEHVEKYDEVGTIISKMKPGDEITLGVQYNEKEMVFENIELAENSDHKGFLGIICEPSSGIILSISQIIVYFFVIVAFSILIFGISAVEKWITRRKKEMNR